MKTEAGHSQREGGGDEKDKSNDLARDASTVSRAGCVIRARRVIPFVSEATRPVSHHHPPALLLLLLTW